MSDILSIQKGLRIIDEVAASAPMSIGTRELARKLEINVTSVHNIATTLASNGFLRKTIKPRGWKLGYHLLNLASFEKFEVVFRDTVKPIVTDFFEELQETVMLTSIYKSQMSRLIYLPADHHALRVDEPQNMDHHSHCTACGKIMLSGLEQNQLNEYFAKTQNRLKKYTNKTIISTTKMIAETKKIRVLGYAQTRDELCEGVSALAVPIRENSGKIIAALGTSIPSVRFKNQWRKDAINKLLKTAEKIEIKIQNA